MKFGVIGTGIIVERFIAAAQDIDGVSFVAVYSRSIVNGVAFARKNGIEKVYIHLEEMLADKDINFIYVASPNSLHFEHTLKSLEAGKNVICEKPFTSEYVEALKLAEVAKNRNLFLFEAITTIHLPNFKKIKEFLPSIAPVKLVKCNYTQYSLKYDKLRAGELPNVFNPQFSGGTFMDLNIYNLHFVMNLFGEPNNIEYFPNLYDNGIDTSGTAILKYPGFICDCTASKDSYGKSYVIIQGQNGYIHVEGSGSLCRRVLFDVQGRDFETNEQSVENILFYEISDFYEIFKNNDFISCYQLLDYSCTVMKYVEFAINSAGIFFNKHS